MRLGPKAYEIEQALHRVGRDTWQHITAHGFELVLGLFHEIRIEAGHDIVWAILRRQKGFPDQRARHKIAGNTAPRRVSILRNGLERNGRRGELCGVELRRSDLICAVLAQQRWSIGRDSSR